MPSANPSDDVDHVENISQVMKKFYDIKGMALDDALKILRGIEKDLIAVLLIYQEQEDDYRLGEDTYGYDDTDNQILNNLWYISDRWKAAFRIAWMLGLINPDYRSWSLKGSPL